MGIFFNLALYIVAFVVIWLGAGLIVSAVDHFSRRLRLSSFAVSFIVLGLLTSIPEFAVGLNSVSQNDPEIFVGNLLGGVMIIFLFVIPLLAIFGNGISLKHELSKRNIAATLLVVSLPSLMVLDRQVTLVEGIIAIITYLVLVIMVQKNHGLLDGNGTNILDVKAYSYKDMLKVLLGIGLVFISSSIIVDQTLYFSNLLNVSPFLISLLVLSLGTNLPELSLAVRSVLSGKKDVAFGDYLGSAAANTLLFGVMTVLIGGEVITQNNFLTTFIFIVGGLLVFYLFAQSKHAISRKEGIILLVLYALFVLAEIFL